MKTFFITKFQKFDFINIKNYNLISLNKKNQEKELFFVRDKRIVDW